MARVLSGIAPTGRVHLGNYLGALRQWVAEQHQADSFYTVVDLHALTVEHDPVKLRERTLELTRVLVAVGLDPDVCTLFIQSHVGEHAQLSWLMESTVTFGELGRMIQFKEKSGGKESVRVALFTYPALMAADILLYDADRVPVGEDQRQHLELTRDLAVRFNHHYGETFVVPEATVPTVGARIMDLQNPTSKMGKSSESGQGTVYLLDDPAEIAEEDPPSGHRRRGRGPLRRGGQARGVEPAVDPGGGHRPHASGAGVRLHRSTGRSRPTRPRPSSSCCDRCRSATGSWPPTPARPTPSCARGPARRSRWRRPPCPGPSSPSASCLLPDGGVERVGCAP